MSAISISGYTASNGNITTTLLSPPLTAPVPANDDTVFTFTVRTTSNVASVVVGTPTATFTTIPAGISIPKLP